MLLYEDWAKKVAPSQSKNETDSWTIRLPRQRKVARLILRTPWMLLRDEKLDEENTGIK